MALSSSLLFGMRGSLVVPRRSSSAIRNILLRRTTHSCCCCYRGAGGRPNLGSSSFFDNKTRTTARTSAARWFGNTTLVSSPARRPVEKVLVVGSGVIGLTTAVELLRRNVSVVLEAPRHPLHPATCSMGAGGLWMPFHVEDDRVTRWAKETLDALLPLAKDPETRHLCEIVPTVMLLRQHGGPLMEEFHHAQYEKKAGESTQSAMLPRWTTDPRIKFQHMTVEMLSWQNISYRLKIPPEQELKEAGYLHAWLFRPPIVNAPKMLQHLLAQVQDSPRGKVNVETGVEFASVQEMRERASQLGCDTVVNCTGLGAAKLCRDKEMAGARGILLQFERSSCVRRVPVRENPYGENVNDAVILAEEEPWGSETMPCYLIPRGDTIVVGGSYLEGDEETSIRDEERARLLINANRLGLKVEASKQIGEWTGFRPFRSKVRCELDDEFASSGGVKVFHSYGYGGSGWTVNVGAARECADVLLKFRNRSSSSK